MGNSQGLIIQIDDRLKILLNLGSELEVDYSTQFTELFGERMRNIVFLLRFSEVGMEQVWNLSSKRWSMQ